MLNMFDKICIIPIKKTYNFKIKHNNNGWSKER